jgi:hypothetical protein
MYMDYMKAFDTVPHRRLMNKLTAYSIENPIFQWIESFLVIENSKCLSTMNDHLGLR